MNENQLLFQLLFLAFSSCRMRHIQHGHTVWLNQVLLHLEGCVYVYVCVCVYVWLSYQSRLTLIESLLAAVAAASGLS